MALNYVTLTGKYLDGSGEGIDGSGRAAFLTFAPTAKLADSTNNTEVPVSPVRIKLSNTGTFSIQLLATDNATLLPAGWAWQVTETMPGVPDNTWNFFLPFAGGSTQDISNLTPVSPVTTMQAYLPLPTGTAASGQVPVATGSGEASAWGTVLANPMSQVGDIITGGASGAPTRLGGVTIATRKFLRSLGSGGIATAPVWDTLLSGDIPSLGSLYLVVATTLDQIAPAAANVSLNSKKITNLANGTAASDAAAFGQTPAGGNTATIGQGGTGQTSQQAAMDALAGGVTNGTYLRANGTHVVQAPIQAGDVPVAAPAAGRPANPATTTSASLVMMGLGVSFTPSASGSGRALVIASGSVTTLVGSVPMGVGGRFGTGSAPANGAAVTGSRFGAATDQTIRPAGITGGVGICIADVLTGLTPGTTYWFDLALSTTNASDAAQLQSASIVTVELP